MFKTFNLLLLTSMVLADRSFDGYERSGWKPSGPAFNSPQRLEVSSTTPSPAEEGSGSGPEDLNTNKPFDQYGPPEPPQTLSLPRNEPAVTYGPPVDTYHPARRFKLPQTQYGAPDELPTTTDALTTTETEPTTTEMPTTTDVEKEAEFENLKESPAVNDGVYFIYHPSGLLQRVVYSTVDDQSNMEYSAKLRYENVEPVKGPVYTYDSETFALKRVYK